METKETRGRKPIAGQVMTQSEYYQRYKEKKKRLGDPNSYEMRAITYAALKRAWVSVPYMSLVELYGAVEKEAVERGLDPGLVVERFREAMTQ
ncbi:hypothetical protein [Azospirillum brasilense]|uniref:hypothetical protein n=1 Tax=Azospirillum brasilense TaxID=192 RepID=UPI000E6815B4|nr:hypothetical protein [Azospirillum brasilense]NUB23334.1 hypothetical protein [Azospirillum brasilense]NUB30956.1 hypothetical protein [Azospirillum brasilense]RIW05660.1 hypothetical protein D2T81_07390 [Azospirillum brasilense]